MTEENIKKAVEEIKSSDEEKLQKVIEDWFSRTRTDGMRIGAQYISAAIFGTIQKHIVKKEKPSLRDFKRCIDEIVKIIHVQFTEQNDSAELVEDDDVNKEIINEPESSI